jgi:DNA repair protein RadD
MLTLRQYQQEAVDAVYAYLHEHDDNPCIELPTASGKTPVIAAICRDAVQHWDSRVLVLAHVKELLAQTTAHIRDIAPELSKQVGLNSAGLGYRDTEHPIIVAGIQSVHKCGRDLGRFDLVLIDEAHLIPADGEGMYRRLLNDLQISNPGIRVIGLTATPFRMRSGSICAPENVLNHICYRVGVRELIVQGYLCPLRSKAGAETIDTSGLHVRAGEFVASETEALMNGAARVGAACREVVEQTNDRNSILVFASGVDHANHIADVLRSKHGVDAAAVFGESLPAFRDQTIADFKSGELKYLVNVNTLTTGFDAPNIDCVVLLRPTLSPGLYHQMVGRGFRLHSSKKDCLVLDYGGNVLRHGPVDAIRVRGPGSSGDGEAPAKQCPDCRALIAAGYSRCPECEHQFPERQHAPHSPIASTAGILTGQSTTTEYTVQSVTYKVHSKRNAPVDAPKTMRVDYLIDRHQCRSEWVCFGHSGYARGKAVEWWRRRSDAPVPDNAEEAVRMAEAGALCATKKITVRSVSGDRYDHIIGYELTDKPPYREPGWDDDAVVPAAETTSDWPRADEIPF